MSETVLEEAAREAPREKKQTVAEFLHDGNARTGFEMQAEFGNDGFVFLRDKYNDSSDAEASKYVQEAMHNKIADAQITIPRCSSGDVLIGRCSCQQHDSADEFLCYAGVLNDVGKTLLRDTIARVERREFKDTLTKYVFERRNSGFWVDGSSGITFLNTFNNLYVDGYLASDGRRVDTSTILLMSDRKKSSVADGCGKSLKNAKKDEKSANNDQKNDKNAQNDDENSRDETSALGWVLTMSGSLYALGTPKTEQDREEEEEKERRESKLLQRDETEEQNNNSREQSNSSSNSSSSVNDVSCVNVMKKAKIDKA